jgi:hypothetical protein
MAKKTKEELVHIKKSNWRELVVTIQGTDPLNIHRLSDKMQQEFEERDHNKPKKKKQERDYNEEFRQSLYYIDKGFELIKPPNKIAKSTRFGFPASGLKKAMVSACRNFANIAMTEARGRFFVLHRYIRIEGKPELDKFWRRIGGKGAGTGTPDIGIRATFKSWAATIYLTYNADLITAESVINLLAEAGMAVGLGEDRPEKSGNTCGRFEVINS